MTLCDLEPTLGVVEILYGFLLLDNFTNTKYSSYSLFKYWTYKHWNNQYRLVRSPKEHW